MARHRAEQQVRRGFTAIETAHDGISLLDADGELVYVNRAYADITGYDREELLGEHREVLYPDADVESGGARFEVRTGTGGGRRAGGDGD